MTGYSRWITVRPALTDHLHHHPDHAARYPAGHDFTLRSTKSIVEEHEHQHRQLPLRASHRHQQAMKVPGEQGYVSREEDMGKNLNLVVTVTGQDPDGTLAKMDKLNLRLLAAPYSLQVTKVVRADGQPFGLESAFEEYWAKRMDEEAHLATTAKAGARDAFMFGVQLVRKEEGKA